MRALVSHRTCSGAGHQNHSGTVPKTGLRLVCSMRAKNLPLWLNSKIDSENEGMPHEGCQQNRSAVSQMPVLLGHFQPGTYLSFLQIIIWQPMRSEAGHNSSTSWRVP